MPDDIKRAKENANLFASNLSLSKIVGQHLASRGNSAEQCIAPLVVRWGCTDALWHRAAEYLNQLCEEGRYSHVTLKYYALGRPGVAQESTATAEQQGFDIAFGASGDNVVHGATMTCTTPSRQVDSDTMLLNVQKKSNRDEIAVVMQTSRDPLSWNHEDLLARVERTAQLKTIAEKDPSP